MSGRDYDLEKILRRVAVFLAVLLILVQGAMLNDDVRYRLSIGEQFEGRPVSQESHQAVQAASDSLLTGQETISPWAEVEIELLQFTSLPKAVVLVNGQWAGSFTEPRLRIRVMGADDIEIDTSNYEFPIQMRINKVSANVVQPGAGTLLKSDGARIYVGKVMVK